MLQFAYVNCAAAIRSSEHEFLHRTKFLPFSRANPWDLLPFYPPQLDCKAPLDESGGECGFEINVILV
jgi:hypothetical protein